MTKSHVHRNNIIDNINVANVDDLPEIVAWAFMQWADDGRGFSDLLTKVVKCIKSHNEEHATELEIHLQDWK